MDSVPRNPSVPKPQFGTKRTKLHKQYETFPWSILLDSSDPGDDHIRGKPVWSSGLACPRGRPGRIGLQPQRGFADEFERDHRLRGFPDQLFESLVAGDH